MSVLALCVGLWLSQAAAAGAGGRRAQSPSDRSLSVTAWLPYWEMPAALHSTLAHAAAITTASPYWYDISGDALVHDEPGAGSAAVVSELTARHEQVVPMVTEASGIDTFARILETPARRAALVHTLVGLAAQRGLAGLDIDFESFAYDPHHRTHLDTRLAGLYAQLIARTCGALHAIRRVCEVAVMARTSAAQTYAHGDIPTWVYDYRALAAVADRVQVMAYDYHSPGGPAGPIAPLSWVRQVIAYARSQGRPDRFELGIAAYGYDWYTHTSAEAVYAGQLAALARQVGARPRWDAVAGEETFTYRSGSARHTVWVVDARADAERARLAAAAGFSGVAVWAAGYEQPELWGQLHAAGSGSGG
jgi:spore germination protein